MQKKCFIKSAGLQVTLLVLSVCLPSSELDFCASCIHLRSIHFISLLEPSSVCLPGLEFRSSYFRYHMLVTRSKHKFQEPSRARGSASINRNPCWSNTRTAGMTNTAAVALSQYTFILAQQVDIHDGKYTRADRTIGLAGKALMCILEGLLRTAKEAKSTQPSTSLLLIPSPIDDNDIASSNHSL